MEIGSLNGAEYDEPHGLAFVNTSKKIVILNWMLFGTVILQMIIFDRLYSRVS